MGLIDHGLECELVIILVPGLTYYMTLDKILHLFSLSFLICRTGIKIASTPEGM